MKRGRTTPTPAIPLVVSLKHAILDKTSMKGTGERLVFPFAGISAAHFTAAPAVSPVAANDSGVVASESSSAITE